MKEYILYGYSDIVPKVLRYIEAHDDKVLFVCDKNPKLWNTAANVYPPEEILKETEACIVLCCTAMSEVVNSLRSMGIKNEILAFPFLAFNFWAEGDYLSNAEYIRGMNDWIAEHKTELFSIYDNESYTRSLLNESIRQRAMQRFDFISPNSMYAFPSVREYFYDNSIAPTGDISLVDGGAYVGDSIEQIYNKFGDRLKKIYAFEPDKNNFQKLKENLSGTPIEENVVFTCSGLYKENTTVFFEQTDNAYTSKISTAGIEVPVCKLDDCIQDIIGDLCIKMDIEGSEMNALYGAESTIRSFHPYMAICTYHRMTDILEIPKYLKSLYPSYKFYLRAGMHTECYAVPFGTC